MSGASIDAVSVAMGGIPDHLLPKTALRRELSNARVSARRASRRRGDDAEAAASDAGSDAASDDEGTVWADAEDGGLVTPPAPAFYGRMGGTPGSLAGTPPARSDSSGDGEAKDLAELAGSLPDKAAPSPSWWTRVKENFGGKTPPSGPEKSPPDPPPIDADPSPSPP
ncbi:hypothetical protein TeGR_g4444, partial [Tetraparma gracilis]